jgi:Uma2 family endonuclease
MLFAMADPARKRASYADVLAASEHMIAQVIDGELVLMPRPAMPHAMASSALGEELGPPFKRGRGGPGGWVIIDEPELHLGEDILVPDLAGWRRQKMPEAPSTPFVTLAPDWACEVLSPSTAGIDRVRKSRIYARERVQHVWLVDPIEQLLEVWRLDGEGYRVALTAAGGEKVRAEPFEAIDLDLAILWAR